MNITIINTSGNSGLVDSVSVKIDDCTIWTGFEPRSGAFAVDVGMSTANFYKQNNKRIIRRVWVAKLVREKLVRGDSRIINMRKICNHANNMQSPANL